jgi:hypothetical protein
MDMQHRLSARTCNTDLPRGRATMTPKHGHEAQKFRTNIREDLGSGTGYRFQCDAAKGEEGNRLCAFFFPARLFRFSRSFIFATPRSFLASKSATVRKKRVFPPLPKTQPTGMSLIAYCIYCITVRVNWFSTCIAGNRTWLYHLPQSQK